MVDCEVEFKAGKYRVMEMLQKSLLYNGFEQTKFESTDRKEIKEHIKKILIHNIKNETNLNCPEDFKTLMDIINHIHYLDSTDNPIEVYCDISNR